MLQEYVRKVDLLILDWKSPPKQGPKEVTVSIGRGEPTKVALWGSREQLLTKFPASIWDAPLREIHLGEAVVFLYESPFFFVLGNGLVLHNIAFSYLEFVVRKNL